MTRPRLGLASLSVAFAILPCCGKSVPSTSPTTGCGARSALVSVGDGYIENLCGCNEANGSITHVGGAFTCTAAAGTTFFFDFSQAHLKHQIIPQGSSSIPQSPLFDPNSQANKTSSYAVTLSTAGTYGFSDAYLPSISGSLIAQ